MERAHKENKMASQEVRNSKIEAMRARMNAKLGGFRKDPDEFRPPNVETGKSKTYYFHILPPVDEEEPFFLKNAAHWINNKTVQCPRVHGTDDCPVCQLGFDLMEGVEDKKARSAIAKKFLPQQKYAINILFTNDQVNGDLAGKVMWFNTPQSVFAKMKDALMRDNAGDNPKKPLAFGDFTDPNASYVFELNITEKGTFNNYDTSDFLPDAPVKIADAKSVLAKRHDLASKFPEPDMKVLKEYEQKMLNGDDSGSDEKTEIKSETKSQSETKSKSEEKTETKSEKTEKAAPETKVEVKKGNEPDDLDKLLADLGV